MKNSGFMIDGDLVQMMWENRHTHIYLGEWLNEEETTYLIKILNHIDFANNCYLKNSNIVDAAKEGVAKSIPWQDTVAELKKSNDFMESIA